MFCVHAQKPNSKKVIPGSDTGDSDGEKRGERGDTEVNKKGSGASVKYGPARTQSQRNIQRKHNTCLVSIQSKERFVWDILYVIDL